MRETASLAALSCPARLPPPHQAAAVRPLRERIFLFAPEILVRGDGSRTLERREPCLSLRNSGGVVRAPFEEHLARDCLLVPKAVVSVRGSVVRNGWWKSTYIHTLHAAESMMCSQSARHFLAIHVMTTHAFGAGAARLCAGHSPKAEFLHAQPKSAYIGGAGTCGSGTRTRCCSGTLIFQLEGRGLARGLRFGLLAFAVIAQLTNPLRLGLRKVNRTCLLRTEAHFRGTRNPRGCASERCAAQSERARARAGRGGVYAEGGGCNGA